MLLKKILLKYKFRAASPKERAKLLKKENYGGIKIGEGCEIYGNVNLGSEPYLIEIGDRVRITAGVTFVTHDGGMWVLRNNGSLPNADYFGKIKIGNNVHIGINSVIMPNVVIGDNVVIGVGSIVTRDIPANSIVVGVPARVVKSVEEYYEKYKEKVDFTKNYSSEVKKKYLLEKYGKG